MSAREAFVTLATTESYCMGATVVGKSLRRHGTTRDIVVMVTPNISEPTRTALYKDFDQVVLVDLMNSDDHLHLSLMGRPELGVTFTKIHCWTLTQYSKCVFLDADTLVLCNVDELFDRDELSAAPDPGWPDCFNSGVFVFKPSMETHAQLLEHALQHGSFDGGDQGLLNSFFNRWAVDDIHKHLPFIYNLSCSSIYSYLPAFRQFGHNAKIVHFLGAVKPWNLHRDGGSSNTSRQFVSLWWSEYQNGTKSSEEQAPASWTPEKPQQNIEREIIETPFRENLDWSNSLLARFSTTAESQPSEEKEERRENHTQEVAAVEEEKVEENEEEESDSSEETEMKEPHDTDDNPSTADAELPDQRSMWEAGLADYLGRDAFMNIQKMLDSFLEEMN